MLESLHGVLVTNIPGPGELAPSGRVRFVDLTFNKPGHPRRVRACSCSLLSGREGGDEYAVLACLSETLYVADLTIKVDFVSRVGGVVSFELRDGMFPMEALRAQIMKPEPSAVMRDALSAEDEAILKVLSMAFDDQDLKIPKLTTTERKLRTRAKNRFIDFGLAFLWQICQRQRESFLPVDREHSTGIGEKTLAVLDKILAANNLSFGMDLTRFRDRLPQPGR